MVSRRILHVVPQWVWGSAELQIASILEELGSQYDFHVATTRVGPRFAPWATKLEAGLHHVSPSRVWGQMAPWELLRVLRRLRPAAIHVWRSSESWLSSLLASLSPRVAIAVDERLSRYPCSWIGRASESWLRQRANFRIIHSAPRFRADITQPTPGNLVHVPDRIELPNLQAAHRADLRAQFRARIGIADSDYLVIAVGGLYRRKGLRDAIWSADLIKVIRGDLHLAIVGDGPERDRLIRFRDCVRIRDRVHILGVCHDLAPVWSAADLLWAVSYREDVPLALYEAQAWGLPVITSDIRPHRHFVEQELAGILVPPGDRSGLARATVRLISDPTFRQTRTETTSGSILELTPRFRAVCCGVPAEMASYSQVYGNLV